MYKLILLFLTLASLMLLCYSLSGGKTSVEVGRPVFPGSPIFVLNQ